LTSKQNVATATQVPKDLFFPGKFLSRLALIFVVEAKQRAKGKRQEGRRF
jgi:hypothetical protein